MLFTVEYGDRVPSSKSVMHEAKILCVGTGLHFRYGNLVDKYPKHKSTIYMFQNLHLQLVRIAVSCRFSLAQSSYWVIMSLLQGVPPKL